MFTVYYETGSLQLGTKQFHHIRHETLKAAEIEASDISKKINGFVSVMKSGIDVAVYWRGEKQ